MCIKVEENIILPLLSYDCETCPFILKEEHGQEYSRLKCLEDYLREKKLC
jgi:hypothetical protein